MIPMEMRLGREIAEEVENNGVVVFRDSKNQPYALFKLKDIEGAVASFSTDSSMYIVTTIKHKEDK
jgi:hypothetical protein